MNETQLTGRQTHKHPICCWEEHKLSFSHRERPSPGGSIKQSTRCQTSRLFLDYLKTTFLFIQRIIDILFISQLFLQIYPRHQTNKPLFSAAPTCYIPVTSPQWCSDAIWTQRGELWSQLGFILPTKNIRNDSTPHSHRHLLWWIKRFTKYGQSFNQARQNKKDLASFFLERPCVIKVISAGISLRLPDNGRWEKNITWSSSHRHPAATRI